MKSSALILALAILTACSNTSDSVTPKLSVNVSSGPSLAVGLSFDNWSAQAAGKEASVGKWASQQKRGTAGRAGVMAAPGPEGTDWQVSGQTATTVSFVRNAAIPSGATALLVRAVNAATGIQAASYNGSPVAGLISGQTYKLQAAWWNGATKVSDDSEARILTQP